MASKNSPAHYALALLCSAFAFFTNSACWQAQGQGKGSAKQKMTEGNWLKELSRAGVVDSGVAGEEPLTKEGKTFGHSLYEKTLDVKGCPDESLIWLFDHGSPAARLYAAFAFSARNQEQGNAFFQRLLKDKTAVKYKSGCCVMNTTVNEIAQTFLEKGKYLDFKSQ